MITSVIFDFDGLIRDTETCEFYSFQELFTTYGLELPLALYSKRICGPLDNTFEPYSYLHSRLDTPIEIETLRTHRRSTYTKLLEQEKERPGVSEYLKTARDMNFKIGLASNATREWVMTNLKELGLTHYFDSIVTSGDVLYNANKIIGAFYISYTPNSEDNYWIGGFQIAKEYQGKGYGKQSLLKIIDFVKEKHSNCKALN